MHSLLVHQAETGNSPIDIKFGKNVVDEIHEIKKNLLSVKSKIEVIYLKTKHSN